MCLINFQFHEHPNYKLIVAANRDEFYGRPTAPARFWDDEPNILAGRDLVQQGTWLGITKQGRFAALTNYRDPEQPVTGKHSRGDIVRSYLAEDATPQNFLESLKENKHKYAGFNIIIGDTEQILYYNNIQDKVTEINTGTHGLSNHYLNTPWPKVTKGKANLHKYTMSQEKVQTDKLFQIISDAEEAQDENLPETGVGLDLERKLSPLFIKTPEYGTRSSTVLLIDNNNEVTFVERTYDKGEFAKENQYNFQLQKGEN